MKRYACILALALALLLAGCGQTAAPEPEQPAQTQPAQEQPEPQPAQTPQYAVRTETAEEARKTEDGEDLASAKIAYPVLYVAGGEADAVCDAFNAHYAEDRELAVLEELCEVSQANFDAAAEIGTTIPASFMETEPVCIYQTDAALFIERTTHAYTGGAHGFSWHHAEYFDLGTGDFFSLAALTDDPDALTARLGDLAVEALYETGETEYYWDDFAETARKMENVCVAFDEDGVNITYPEYALAAYAMGMPRASVPYARFADLLNERGRRLLALPEETLILADYYAAAEMWRWFDSTTMPLDQSSPMGDGYYPVQYRGVTTMAALRALLETRFAPALVESLLDPDDPHYREIGGVLCAIEAARGDDITRGKAEYAVQREGDGGKVVATVEELDWDAYTEGMEAPPVKGHITLEFPFTLTEHGAVFTAFESIW